MESLGIDQLQIEYIKAMQAVDSQIEAGNIQETVISNEIRLGLRLINSRLGEFALSSVNSADNRATLFAEKSEVSQLSQSKLIGPKQAADFLGCHISTLRRWSDNGHIKAIKTPGGKRRYDLNNLIKFIESQ